MFYFAATATILFPPPTLSLLTTVFVVFLALFSHPYPFISIFSFFRLLIMSNLSFLIVAFLYIPISLPKVSFTVNEKASTLIKRIGNQILSEPKLRKYPKQFCSIFGSQGLGVFEGSPQLNIQIKYYIFCI